MANVESIDGKGDRDLLEWAEWEIEKVERSMLAVSAAMGQRPESTNASIPDSALDGLLCVLMGNLKQSREAIGKVIERGFNH